MITHGDCSSLVRAPASTTDLDSDTRTFPPFGAIPHDCPGRNLAMFEATMVAAMLVRSFEITLTARLTARPAADRPP